MSRIKISDDDSKSFTMIHEDVDFPEEASEVTNLEYFPAPERPPAAPPGLGITISDAFIDMLWQAYKAGAGTRHGNAFACRREFELWYGSEISR
jgi:hypothetical protein